MAVDGVMGALVKVEAVDIYQQILMLQGSFVDRVAEMW